MLFWKPESSIVNLVFVILCFAAVEAANESGASFCGDSMLSRLGKLLKLIACNCKREAPADHRDFEVPDNTLLDEPNEAEPKKQRIDIAGAVPHKIYDPLTEVVELEVLSGTETHFHGSDGHSVKDEISSTSDMAISSRSPSDRVSTGDDLDGINVPEIPDYEDREFNSNPWQQVLSKKQKREMLHNKRVVRQKHNTQQSNRERFPDYPKPSRRKHCQQMSRYMHDPIVLEALNKVMEDFETEILKPGWSDLFDDKPKSDWICLACKEVSSMNRRFNHNWKTDKCKICKRSYADLRNEKNVIIANPETCTQILNRLRYLVKNAKHRK